MEKWLAIGLVFIVSLFTFWKLGEHNESQNNKIKESEKKSKSIARGNSAGESARSEWLSKHK